MIRDKNQTLRFNKAELQFLKGLFADREELLYAIRKVFLQLPISPDEETMIKELTPEAHELIKKFFLPDLDGDSPIFQLTDMKLAIGADIKNLSPDGAWLYIKAKEVEIRYLEQQLGALKDMSLDQKLSLESLSRLDYDKSDADEAFINMTARNYILSFIDSNLNQIKLLAGLPNDSVEDTLKKLARDSSK